MTHVEYANDDVQLHNINDKKIPRPPHPAATPSLESWASSI